MVHSLCIQIVTQKVVGDRKRNVFADGVRNRDYLFGHDFIRRPVSTFRDHAVTGTTAMRKFLIGAAIALPLSLIIVPASALPGTTHGAVLGEQLSSDIVQIKRGGHGGRGWGRVHASKPLGWSRGRKVGWRGAGCPPGLRKQGRC